MALTKINNNTLSAVTTLPSAIVLVRFCKLNMTYGTGMDTNDSGNGTTSGI